MFDYAFPWFTSIWWAVFVFFVGLLVFHVAFVWAGKLTSIQWKQVDYVWVSIAFLGILATVEQNKSLVARNYVEVAEARVASSFASVRRATDFGTSPAICRIFVRSPVSPSEESFQAVQRQFDAQCEWFTKLAVTLKNLDLRAELPLEIQALAEPRPSGGEPWAYAQIDKAIADYNNDLSELGNLRAAASMSNLHMFIALLGPFLLALAVALRLAKVSGEIALERSRNRSQA